MSGPESTVTCPFPNLGRTRELALAGLPSGASGVWSASANGAVSNQPGAMPQAFERKSDEGRRPVPSPRHASVVPTCRNSPPERIAPWALLGGCWPVRWGVAPCWFPADPCPSGRVVARNQAMEPLWVAGFCRRHAGLRGDALLVDGRSWGSEECGLVKNPYSIGIPLMPWPPNPFWFWRWSRIWRIARQWVFRRTTALRRADGALSSPRGPRSGSRRGRQGCRRSHRIAPQPGAPTNNRSRREASWSAVVRDRFRPSRPTLGPRLGQ